MMTFEQFETIVHENNKQKRHILDGIGREDQVLHRSFMLLKLTVSMMPGVVTEERWREGLDKIGAIDLQAASAYSGVLPNTLARMSCPLGGVPCIRIFQGQIHYVKADLDECVDLFIPLYHCDFKRAMDEGTSPMMFMMRAGLTVSNDRELVRKLGMLNRTEAASYLGITRSELLRADIPHMATLLPERFYLREILDIVRETR